MANIPVTLELKELLNQIIMTSGAYDIETSGLVNPDRTILFDKPYNPAAPIALNPSFKLLTEVKYSTGDTPKKGVTTFTIKPGVDKIEAVRELIDWLHPKWVDGQRKEQLYRQFDLKEKEQSAHTVLYSAPLGPSAPLLHKLAIVKDILPFRIKNAPRSARVLNKTYGGVALYVEPALQDAATADNFLQKLDEAFEKEWKRTNQRPMEIFPYEERCGYRYIVGDMQKILPFIQRIGLSSADTVLQLQDFLEERARESENRESEKRKRKPDIRNMRTDARGRPVRNGNGGNGGHGK